MRRLSARRRRISGVAASMAAMSGLGGVMARRHAWMEWVWLAMMLALLGWVVLEMFRLRKEEGCG